MSVLDFLGWNKAGSAGARSQAETDTVRKIAASLERLDPERARFVAAFAYLLSRVANADMEFSPEETREMERIVSEKAGLPEEQAVLAVHMAKTQNALFGGVENFLVTREFNRIATHEQKIGLLHCLFAVSAADRSVSSVEDVTIRQISSELFLDHRDFVEVKSAYRGSLAVLKDPPESGGSA